MSEFKDKIPAAGGKVEFLYDPSRGIRLQISGGFRGAYQVVVSLDGRDLLGTVPAGGIGQTMVYPQPSLLTFIQSDDQGMWGRNCPLCKKYFRTNHVMNDTCCPYCAVGAPGLDFVTKEQLGYIAASYDAYARARLEKKNTSVDIADITDKTPAWHYSEEKQQFHFTCVAKDCQTQTDILGRYGYCPRCERTNARALFTEWIGKALDHWQETNNTISDRKARGEVWESMTVTALSEFEPLAKHLRNRLLRFPMTSNRRKRLEQVNFQKPLQANESLVQWFDIGLLEWAGNEATPKRGLPVSDVSFIRKMIQRRHILMHSGGLVDREYLEFSGDTHVRLNERISIPSHEAKRFIECVGAMAANLLDNVEFGFKEG